MEDVGGALTRLSDGNAWGVLAAALSLLLVSIMLSMLPSLFSRTSPRKDERPEQAPQDDVLLSPPATQQADANEEEAGKPRPLVVIPSDASVTAVAMGGSRVFVACVSATAPADARYVVRVVQLHGTRATLARSLAETAMVLSLAASKDGSRVVAGRFDATASVWDATTGAKLGELKCHTDVVRGVAFFDLVASGTQRRVGCVTASWDATCHVWDFSASLSTLPLPEQTPSATFANHHTKEISAVAVSESMRVAVSVSADTTARVWRLDTAEQVHCLAKHTDSVRSVDCAANVCVTGSFDQTAIVWSLETGEALVRVSHEWFVQSCCFLGGSSSSSSSSLSSSSSSSLTRVPRRFVTGSLGNDAVVWEWFGDVDGGNNAVRVMRMEEDDAVGAVASSRDGRVCVTGSDARRAVVWDLVARERELVVAFCAGAHERVGRRCVVRKLPIELVRLVRDFLM